MEKNAQHINSLCDEFQTHIDESSDKCVKNEDIQGQIQTAIGKGQLLINQKFKQFRGLCEKNIVIIFHNFFFQVFNVNEIKIYLEFKKRFIAA